MEQVLIKRSSFKLILEFLELSHHAFHECFTVVNVCEITIRFFRRKPAFSIPDWNWMGLLTFFQSINILLRLGKGRSLEKRFDDKISSGGGWGVRSVKGPLKLKLYRFCYNLNFILTQVHTHWFLFNLIHLIIYKS